MPKTDINASDPVIEWAERTPWAVAIIEGEQVIHYRTLRLAMLRAMTAMRDAGLKPGQVVGISMEGNVALQLAVSLALARSGLTQVWLPLSDPPEYREKRVRDLGVSAVVFDKSRGGIYGVASLSPNVAWFSGDSVPPDIRIRRSGEPMILIQSSGTSGDPKDIVVSHDEVLLYSERSNAVCDFRSGERFMSLTGVHFWSGVNSAWRCLSSGATLVVPPERWTAAELAYCIDLHNVTSLACTPLHLRILLENSIGSAPRFPGIRMLRCATAALPVATLNQVMAGISPNVYTHYGSNEAGPIAVATPGLLGQFPDCTGVALEGIALEVVDANHRPLQAGSPGQVRVRGKGINARRMRGISSDASDAYQGEWFYPGDIGVLNAEGILFLKGRSDDVMNFDGIMVGPSEIESVLSRHPAIADSAAFPLPSPLHQDVPAAAIVLRHPFPMEELEAYCRKHLAIRTPRMFFVMDVIPRNPMGKILRRRLTELAVEHVNKAPAASRDATSADPEK